MQQTCRDNAALLVHDIFIGMMLSSTLKRGKRFAMIRFAIP
jgi:hypothetical protein